MDKEGLKNDKNQRGAQNILWLLIHKERWGCRRRQLIFLGVFSPPFLRNNDLSGLSLGVWLWSTDQRHSTKINRTTAIGKLWGEIYSR